MKNCPHCGKANDPSAFYCEACGQIIEKPANNDLYTVNKREEMYGVTHRSTPETLHTPPSYQETPNYATPNSYDPYGAQEIQTPYTQQAVGMQAPYYATPMYSPLPTEQKRSVGGIILSIVLYLFNLFWAVLGVFGFLTAFTSDNTMPTIALLVAFLLGIMALVVIMIQHKKPRLKWWVRLLAFLGVMIIGFIVLIIAEGLSSVVPAASHGQVEDIYLGGTLVVFGILAMIASVL